MAAQTLILVMLIFIMFFILKDIIIFNISKYVYLEFKSLFLMIFFNLFITFISFITPFILLKRLSITSQLNIE